jgi:predicted acetyltransferase
MKRFNPSMVTYSGEIWSGEAVHVDLWALLNQKNVLIERSHGNPPYHVVIGVPHHAALGIPKIATAWVNPRTEKKGRPADEVAGLTGLAVFTALQTLEIPCKLVIAAEPADHDPNKTPGSPYWQRVFAAPLPGLLLELHGAGNHRRHTLELSAGNNHITDPLAFGRILIRYLNHASDLAVQARPGSSEARLFQPRQRTQTRLQNPALRTASITHAGLAGVRALHLEMKSHLRQPDPAYPDSPRPSQQAWHLARALALTIRALRYPGGIFIPASDLGLPSTAFLTSPSPAFEASYLSATREEDQREPAGLDDLNIQTRAGFSELVRQWDVVAEDPLPPDSQQDAPLSEEILWLVDQGEFIGRVFIFHWLNEFRRQTDGQVDYWIRPSRRGQGYGRLILRLALERFRQIGSRRILITCDAENTASRKIIEASGGVFEAEIHDDLTRSGLRRRYWISL